MSLKTIPLVVAAVAVLSFAPLSAFARTIHFGADLSSAKEVPPHQTDGSGKVSATYNTATKVFTYEATYDKLTGPATAAHFHGPAAVGKNAPPVIPIPADNLASPIKGKATLTAAQAHDLTTGLWYFNVHTDANKGGEIRGQIEETK